MESGGILTEATQSGEETNKMIEDSEEQLQGSRQEYLNAMSTSGVKVYNLTIHYQDESGKKLAEDFWAQYIEGESFEIRSPSINGYVPDYTIVSSSDSRITPGGKGMPADNLELTVTYKQKKITAGEIIPDVPTVKKNFSVDSPANCIYNGKTNKWEPTVTDEESSEILEKEKDYTVSYTTDDFINVGEIGITITGIGNYTGSYTRTYQITKKELTLISESGTQIYNGQPLRKQTVTAIGLVEEDKDLISYTVTGSRSIVGTSSNSFIHTFSDPKKEQDYDVKKQYGTLIVTPRSVTLTSASKTKTYDGTALTAPTVTAIGLLEEDKNLLEYNITGSQTHAGSSDNTFTYRWLDNTKARNYTITTNCGKLQVTPRRVTLTSASKTKKFDGKPLIEPIVYSNRINSRRAKQDRI